MPIKKSSLKVFILDFDGTLVDSNMIKDWAFEKIFSNWPEHKEDMMEWHLTRNSIDREEKFRYFVEKVLKMPGNDKLIKKLVERFSKLTTDLIIECPLVRGTNEFLEYFHHNTSMFLLSATPQKVLNKIILAKGLDKYFKQIIGAPINKTETVRRIQAIEKVSTDEMIFIGDSPEDQQAAEKIGILFTARKSDRTVDNRKNFVFDDMISCLNFFKNQKNVQ